MSIISCLSIQHYPFQRAAQLMDEEDDDSPEGEGANGAETADGAMTGTDTDKPKTNGIQHGDDDH
jgi:hypothetical protein